VRVLSTRRAAAAVKTSLVGREPARPGRARVDEAVRRIEQICLPLIHEETGHVRGLRRRN
jgi:hypothetical protein